MSSPALLLIVWTTGVCIPCKHSVRRTESSLRGFAKRAAIYFLHFTALWFLVVASIPPSIPPRHNFECFSRIRIGRPDSAVGQSAAVDTRWGRQTRPPPGLDGALRGGGWATAVRLPGFWSENEHSEIHKSTNWSLGFNISPCRFTYRARI